MSESGSAFNRLYAGDTPNLLLSHDTNLCMSVQFCQVLVGDEAGGALGFGCVAECRQEVGWLSSKPPRRHVLVVVSLAVTGSV